MDQISRAAEYIAYLRFALRQEPQIPEPFRPQNIAAGYAVQEGVVSRLLQKYGGRAIGYKVACTNKLPQKLLGTDTPLFKWRVLRQPASGIGKSHSQACTRQGRPASP